MTKEEYWYWLCHIDGLGSVRIRQLLEFFGDAQAIFDASEDQVRDSGILSSRLLETMIQARKGTAKICRSLEKLVKKQIRFIPVCDPLYPQKLKEIYDPPCCLYVKGDARLLSYPCAAIVGARQCTEYGRQAAAYFAGVLAGMGIAVVSGMAVGIDAAAHRGALNAGGPTIAVLASDVSTSNPRENLPLYLDISQNGAVISEYDDRRTVPGMFPVRNRIISGMADCVLVMEAREKSGSLITADQALEQGREVFALPGRMDDPFSRGCNALIKSGAQILTGPEDVLSCFAIGEDAVKRGMKANGPARREPLTKREAYVYGFVGTDTKHLEQLLEETGLPVSDLLEILLQLELKKYVRQPIKNYYSAFHFP